MEVKKKKRAPAPGLLKQLSDACLGTLRREASTGLLAYVWDNINFMLRVAEQILGRKDTQENGTCATAFKLYNARPEDMKTRDLVDSFTMAPSLSVDDILLSEHEDKLLHERLAHTVLRIVVTFGGDRFARFRSDTLSSTPTTDDKIPLHKTTVMPLPAMNIDESSTTGNAEVLTEIFTAAQLDMDSDDFTRHVKLLCGDQLSIARLRSIITARSGHDSFGHSFLWALCMPGLFHYKMTATHGIIEMFYGHSNTSRNPGSLSFHNTVLTRKPIVLTSLPPFRTCRDLIFVSLYARVLHCLLLVTGSPDLDDYAQKTTFAQLTQDCALLVSRFAQPHEAQKLRQQRETERRRYMDDVDDEVDDLNGDGDGAEDEQSKPSSPPPTQGDMVFENAVLFMRDALLLREWTDAIKAGDSGRVITVLKVWALGFRGSGRTKYAYETLHVIHNLTHVWPEPLRCVASTPP